MVLETETFFFLFLGRQTRSGKIDGSRKHTSETLNKLRSSKIKDNFISEDIGGLGRVFVMGSGFDGEELQVSKQIQTRYLFYVHFYSRPSARSISPNAASTFSS